MSKEIIRISGLPDDQIPEVFRSRHYWDLDKHSFEHAELVQSSRVVFDILDRLDGNTPGARPQPSYAKNWLQDKVNELGIKANTVGQYSVPGTMVSGNVKLYQPGAALVRPATIKGSGQAAAGKIVVMPGAELFGCHLDVSGGDLFIGENSVVEPGAYLKGPTVVGSDNTLRSGVYVRENCVLGSDCIVRGEMKNVLIMPGARLTHPSYIGDSVLGANAHFAYGAVATNLRLDRRSNAVRLEGKYYDTGRKKFGVIMGDGCEIGANAIINPGTLLPSHTVIWPLMRVGPGVHRSRKINSLMRFARWLTRPLKVHVQAA